MVFGSGFIDALRFYILLFEAVMGADETGARVGGRNAWVHTAVTPNVTLLSPHWRRGYEGTVHAGVLQFFERTLISDCWSAYFIDGFKYSNATCGGHILRELVAAAYFREQRWAVGMFDLLLEVLSEKRDAVEREAGCLPPEYLFWLDTTPPPRYNDINRRRLRLSLGLDGFSGSYHGGEIPRHFFTEDRCCSKQQIWCVRLSYLP